MMRKDGDWSSCWSGLMWWMRVGRGRGGKARLVGKRRNGDWVILVRMGRTRSNISEIVPNEHIEGKTEYGRE